MKPEGVKMCHPPAVLEQEMSHVCFALLFSKQERSYLQFASSCSSPL